MYLLFERYYEGVSRDVFEQDLNDKDDVILLRDMSGRIMGFSTSKLITHENGGQQVSAIFSGDTVVERSYWGDLSLVGAFMNLAAQKKAESKGRLLYWFLIVKGHRTFRYLPLFFRSFYPNWRSETPGEIQSLMDSLALERFGSDYDCASGTVRFSTLGCRLRSGFADIPGKDVKRDEVQFFLQMNPDYRKGNELVCLAEIREENLSPFAQRAFRGVEAS